MLNKRGITILLGVIALFVILHLGFSPADHAPRTTMATLLGGIAFLLMTTSIVLATRNPVLEQQFGGLDRMYQVHRVVGTVAAIFALVHFFTIPKELPVGVDPVANSLTPSAPLGMLGLIFLVIGLFMALNRKISYSRWRPAHKAMGLVYAFVIGHFITAPSVFFERFSVSGILLILAAIIGVLAFFYTIFGMNKKTAYPFTVESVNALERATEVVLKADDKIFDYTPGQFAFLEVEGKGWNEPHPFTISSAPGEDRLRFTIKVLGDWTRQVREGLEPGMKVKVRGPYGCFDSSLGGGKQIWLAGGIGVTPFLSTIRDMKADDPREVGLVYATRNPDDALFLDELEARAAELSNFRLVPIYSDEGQFARVDIMKERLPEALANYDYFLCGPKPMVDNLIKDLKKEGVARRQIHTEAFEFR